MDMKKAIIIGILAALASSNIKVQAQTALPNLPPKPITLKLGAFFPSGGDLRNGVGNTFFAAGAEYAFSPGREKSLVPLVYVDYVGKSRSRNTDDGQGNPVSLDLTATSVGIGGGVRFYTHPSPALSPYFGGGLGLYFNHFKANADSTVSGQTISASDSANKTRLGFKINAGVEFQRTYFIEAAYSNPGSVESTRTDGFSLLVGGRF